MTKIPPARRLFRFSLRTLFVVVTLACVWLAWQVRVVQHRMAMLKQLQETNVAYVPTWWNNQWVQDEDWLHHSQVTFLRNRDEARQPNWFRKLLGDCTVFELGFDRELTDADRHAIEAFPEAAIEAWPSKLP